MIRTGYTAAHFTVNAGRLYWKHLREMLDSEIWHGSQIQYREDKGFLSKNFHIKGQPADVNRIQRRITNWLANAGAL